MTGTNTPSFPIRDTLFPPDYYGQTEPVQHQLPVYSEGGDGPSFKDVIDTLNPLQHLPIISAIYREVTGDQPGAVARVAGAALYGGPIGLFSEVINSAIDDNTGKDVGGHGIAFLEDAFGGSSDGGTAVAQDAPPASAAAATPDTQAEPPVPAAAPQPSVAQAVIFDAPAPPPPAAAAAASTPPVAVAAATPPVPPAKPVDQASAAMAAAKYMAVPQRRAVDPVQPPLVPAFLSNNGQYVAIPQQAHNPKRSAQPALAADTQQLAAIPASAPGPGGLTGQDWFAANMMTALDKYERAAKAGQVKTDLAAP